MMRNMPAADNEIIKLRGLDSFYAEQRGIIAESEDDFIKGLPYRLWSKRGAAKLTFPKMLDNAKVLYYTPKDDYGKIYYTGGGVADEIGYLAICKYENDEEAYYLFRCDDRFEVVQDSVWKSIEECMSVAASSYQRNVTWIAALPTVRANTSAWRIARKE